MWPFWVQHGDAPPPSQLTGMVVELECQVKLAEQYKTSLATVQQLHCKCQEEAAKMRSQLLAKETDLSRMLTALQLTSTQVCGVWSLSVGSGHMTVT